MSTEIPAKPRMKRWLRVVLVLSLTMNLMVIGLVGGAALRFGRSGPPPHIADHVASPIIGALERKDRHDIGRSIRKAYRTYADQAENRKTYYEQIAQAIEADPIDPDALLAASVALDDRMSQRRLIAQKAWIEKVSGMAPDERKAYATRLREILENPKDWRKRPSRKD